MFNHRIEAACAYPGCSRSLVAPAGIAEKEAKSYFREQGWSFSPGLEEVSEKPYCSQYHRPFKFRLSVPKRLTKGVEGPLTPFAQTSVVTSTDLCINGTALALRIVDTNNIAIGYPPSEEIEFSPIITVRRRAVSKELEEWRITFYKSEFSASTRRKTIQVKPVTTQHGLTSLLACVIHQILRVAQLVLL